MKFNVDVDGTTEEWCLDFSYTEISDAVWKARGDDDTSAEEIDANATVHHINPPPKAHRVTLCSISGPVNAQVGERTLFAVGDAICHPVDQFCYETGRKKALARALEGMDRDIRKQVWTAYFRTKTIHRVSSLLGVSQKEATALLDQNAVEVWTS